VEHNEWRTEGVTADTKLEVIRCPMDVGHRRTAIAQRLMDKAHRDNIAAPVFATTENQEPNNREQRKQTTK
jgi:hypothetical protein